MSSYTLNELLEVMAPQSRRDKALIGRCVEGLGLYAAQIAEENKSSSKIGEIRDLAECLISYWGLDSGEGSKSADELLQTFDNRVDEAKTGGLITGDVYQTAHNVIYGLYRYGEDMVSSMGAEAMNYILDTRDFMKDIAKHWDFESGVLDDLTAHLEAEVRVLLESTPLPGQSLRDVVNAGYTVTQAVLYDNDRGFALAHSKTAPPISVTWQLTNDNGDIHYYWGKYRDTEESAKIDYIIRAMNYKGEYGLKEKPLPLAAHEMIEPVPESGTIPVQVTTEKQPLVTVTFSECDQLRDIKRMPLYLANTIFSEADEKQQRDFANLGSVKSPYLKTDFRIDFMKDGNPESYEGRYDVGNGDGTLTGHIRNRAEFLRLDKGHQQHLASVGVGDGHQVLENARLDFIARVLVPLFDKHCEISALEASVISELMGIHEAAGGQPSEADIPRIAHLESVVDYAGRCREALCNTGLDNLPEAPAPYVAATPEMNEAEANFAGWLAVTESSRYQWVEDEIYRLNGRGAMYYTGGEDGVYMRIDKDGKLDAGNYEGAIPHIGEAMFKSAVTKQYDSFSAAYQAAMEAGGKQFMVDMFSGPAHQPVVKAAGREAAGDKPSVLDEIRESRSAPKPKPERDKTKKKNQPEH